MIRLTHLSDFHVHKDDDKNKNTKRRMERLSELFKDSQEVVINIATGDIIDDGEADQLYSVGRIGGSAYRRNFIMCAGNHDVAKWGNEVLGIGDLENATKRFQFAQQELLNGLQDKLQLKGLSLIRTTHIVDNFIHEWFWFLKKKSKVAKQLIELEIPEEKTVILLLDSNPTELNGINFARGEIGPKQLGIMSSILNSEKYCDYIKVVALHHHPQYNDTFLKLIDADEFMKRVYNTADLVLCGHKHEYNLKVGRQSQKYNGYLSFAGAMSSDSKTIKITSFIIDKGQLKHEVYFI